ncbi:LOW QUALITY PROTEIN: Terpene synthase, N-terminal domain [Dillenia turbinata]|uniref:Terpene synthase, N-terminal domain n=1 Tax=Dillenia turbinata TaxID=194707 RepID=A0AAN8ZF39_9MAGN
MADHGHKFMAPNIKSETIDIKHDHERRSANYKPNIWNYDSLVSLSNKYTGEKYEREAQKLRMEVKSMFYEANDQPAKLELIDSIQKLGIAYLFGEEINEALEAIASTKINNAGTGVNLYFSALCFRLLRQHGHDVSLDLFTNFLDKTGSFKRSIFNDIEGMLELYECSHLALEGRMSFAKLLCNGRLREIRIDRDLAKQVEHALDLPLYWRVPWFDTKWQINMCAAQEGKSSNLVDLAKFNFNMIQATHQQELINLSRWDFNETQQLPECMKICFKALYDTANDTAYEIEAEKDCRNVLPHLKQAWAEFCNALFTEAKWYNQGYTATPQEYLSNAWISSSGPVISTHVLLSISDDKKVEVESFSEKNQELVYCSSMIVRLCNDLGTSSAELERGDSPSSILCYMREGNASEEMARKHIRSLIIQTWERINKIRGNQPPSGRTFVSLIANVARVAQWIYQYGDGFGDQDRETKAEILSLLIEPLALG